jgi:uncharacterized protein (TIGR02246 family)
MNCRSWPVLTCAVWLLAPSIFAVQPAQEDPVHGELRTFRDAIIDAVNKNDRDRLLTFLHKNVVVTWMDGEVSRGREGVKAYYDRMMTGDQRIVDSVQIQPTVDELSIVYGGTTAIAFGSSDDDFKLKRGLQFKVHSRWTATLVKEQGKWLIAAFHASTSLFDNPLLNTAKTMIPVAAGIAGLAGLVLGLIVARLMRRRRP